MMSGSAAGLAKIGIEDFEKPCFCYVIVKPVIVSPKVPSTTDMIGSWLAYQPFVALRLD